MRRFSHFGRAAVLAIALVCAAPVSAAADPLPGGIYLPYPIGREQVFELVLRQTQFSFVDVGTPGPSQGDEFVLSGDLLQGAATVGTFGEVCTLTRVGPVADSFDQQCVGTLVLADGQITIQGIVSVTAAGPGDITVAITGGTGRYRTAHGYVHATLINATDTGLTVHLIR
ncbi:allene oxide cyclase barrel-like domain-containing protein [Streptomyces botrytidirepellens]|uniref:Allene oxide cyclase barrel-like domain-containing protein n=1 Tax=Streptomyces botrytidirepellens TaxID=2486417 RepID=A0A3M8XEE0_9ACTN|nr:hypothetical protein [Streptomyces botrytidirepellens]RNG38833.1 hypothetical protein EEJ42_00525 [Streptomyces botrytidirepellens]